MDTTLMLNILTIVLAVLTCVCVWLVIPYSLNTYNTGADGELKTQMRMTLNYGMKPNNKKLETMMKIKILTMAAMAATIAFTSCNTAPINEFYTTAEVKEKYNVVDSWIFVVAKIMKSKDQKWKVVYAHFSNFVQGQCTFGEVNVDLYKRFRAYLLNTKKLKHTEHKVSLNSTADTNIYTVSKMLTHRNVSTTQIYAELVSEKKRESAKKSH